LDQQRDREQHHFYISDIGKCLRVIFFNFKKAPKEEMRAERLRLFEYGDHIQQLIFKPLFSKGIVRATEVNIPPQQIISGRADAIVSIDGVPYVLDVKSISGKMNLQKMEKPKLEHYYQVQLYLHYFRIQKGILLYVNKDTQELKEFVFDYDSEIAKNCLNWFEKLKTKIEANIVPARLSDFPNNWQCRDCQFKEICSMADGGEVRWEDFKKKIEAQSESK